MSQIVYFFFVSIFFGILFCNFVTVNYKISNKNNVIIYFILQ